MRSRVAPSRIVDHIDEDAMESLHGIDSKDKAIVIHLLRQPVLANHIRNGFKGVTANRTASTRCQLIEQVLVIN